jgi:putative glutamine amidotransferase
VEFKDKTNKGFMVAVQWHPERMKDKESNGLSKNIKKGFLAAIRSV